MDLLPFAKGAGVGLAVAMPVGPMSVLCMRRTLTKGWRFGFDTGVGIASGDGIYASVAALGVTSVSRFMLLHNKPLHLITGLFLLYLGLKTFAARPKPLNAIERSSTGGGYASALLLTLTNPPTILSFAAIFTILAPAAGFDIYTAAQTVAGVFFGSTLWWLILTATVAMVRHAVGRRPRLLIDRISGALLCLFGVVEIRRAL